MAGFGEFLFGQSGGNEQVPIYSQQQQQLQGQLTGGLGQPMGAGMRWLQQLISQDPQAMQQFEAPMMRQFEQQTVPGIAERFAGMGSHGAQNSSAMQQTMGQAGRELSESLGALRGQLGMGAMSQLQQLLGQGMRPEFENQFVQPNFGMVGEGLKGGMSLAGGMATKKMFGF